MDLSVYPTAALYAVFALLTAGTGLGVIVYQSGATQRAMATRRGMLVGGVLLILIGALVLVTQILAVVSGSYGGLPGNAP